jgi:hypothetical protein
MRSCALVVGLALCLALAPAWARADIVGPPGDPARSDKIKGIVVADVGVGVLGAGIALLAVRAAHDPADVPFQRDLYLAGGLTTAVGASMVGIGFLVWMVARQRTAEWRAASRR